jgi:hypothetical protein
VLEVGEIQTGAKTMNKLKFTLAVISILIANLFTIEVSADHAWGKYHWDLSFEESKTSPIVLMGSLTGLWPGSLLAAEADWNNGIDEAASVLYPLNVSDPSGVNDSDCSPTSGRVEVCNGDYGYNGWLGIASIWATRGKSNHIVQGTVRVNDYYFDSAPYSTEAWRDFVMCQEVGHTFGLDHQDENFSNANLGTCMDYTSNPGGGFDSLSNIHPNQHDYDELDSIYAHLNETSTDTDEGSGNGNGRGNGKKPQQASNGDNRSPNNPSEWGQAVRQDAQGRNSLFVRDLGNNLIIITHVLWAI